MASIHLDGIEKIFPNGHAAARRLNLEVADGEMMVLVGPSGCGKSTALRIVAGLESPTAGHVVIGDRDVTKLPPGERDLAMVFQSYALYPHLTVKENLSFGLRMRRVNRETAEERVAHVAGVLGLEALLARKPAQLSGGQRQRVALGRAMVREPKAFLLDEPLSNLDARLRMQTRAELARMHRQLGATMLYVTHDQEEAMTLGDRTAVMKDGEILQVDRPREIYERPASLFVAELMGSPPINSLPCRIVNHRLDCGAFAISWPSELPESENAVLAIRPHDISLAQGEEADLAARVEVVQELGSGRLVHLASGEPPGDVQLRMVIPSEISLGLDQTVRIAMAKDKAHLFDAVSGKRIGR